MRRARPALAVSLVTALFYLPGLWGVFLAWDDWNNFTQNPNYRGFTAHNIEWMLTTRLMGHYHPLTWFTLALDYEIYGMKPWGYHLTSLLFHAASAGLLFLVLKQLFESTGAAAIGALFWSLHPLRVESVSWVTERRDVVCGVFFLLSVLAYLRMCREQTAGGRGTRWLALSVAAFAASLLSKSLGIMLPLALLVLDVVVLGRFTPGNRRRVLLEKVPYLACGVAIFLVMFVAMKELGQVRATADPLERIAQASFGACFYVWKSLLPWNLSPLYPVNQGIRPSEARFVVCMIAAPLVTAGLALLARKRPAPLATWVAYLILTAPVLGAVVRGPQIAADRYTYLSTIPFSLLLAGALRKLLETTSRRRWIVAASAVGLALGTLTAFQTRIWRTDIALWNHAIDAGWGGAVAFTNRGAERFRAGDIPGSMVDFEEALRHNPKDAIAWLNRGKVAEMRQERERALEEYGRAIECDLRSPEALERRAFVRDSMGDTAGAMADCDQAIRQFPAAGGPWLLRARIKMRLKDLPGAIADFDMGLMRSRRDATAYHERGKCRFYQGDHDGAWRDFTTAIDLDPRLRGPRLDRGSVMGLKGKFPAAVMDFTEELRLDPNSLDAWRGRGLARMRMGARAEAAADFEQLLKIAPPGWAGRQEAANLLAELRKR